MIWIETDRQDLIECSMIKINQVTPTQFILVSQNGIQLLETRSHDEAVKIIEKVKWHIQNDYKKVFSMLESIKEIRGIK